MRLLLFSTIAFIFVAILNCENYDEEGWKSAATFLKQGFDAKAKPCENFMNYACGKWFNSSLAKEELTQQFAQSMIMAQYVTDAIAAINVEDKKTPKFKIWIKTFFNLCQSQVADNKTEMVKELFIRLVKILGTPPILTTNQTEKNVVLKRNVWNFLGHLQREIPSVKIFFIAKVGIINEDCIGNKPVLNFVSETWEKNHLRLDAQKVENYTHLMANILHVKLNEQEVQQKINKMIEFENELIDFYNTTEQAAARNANANQEGEGEGEKEVSLEDTVTIEQLEVFNPNISWSEYFHGLFSKEQYNHLNQSQPLFFINDADYFAQLDDVVNKFDPETIFNYIFYVTITQFYKEILSEENKDAGKCANIVINLYKSASTRLVFDHLNLDGMEFRHDVELITETIFSAFRFLVYGSDWLNAEEKVAIIDKANGITWYCGIPDWFKNDTEIELRTIPLTPEATTVQNFITLSKTNFDRKLDQIVGVGDANAEDEPHLDVNAQYGAMHIDMFAGFLLPPLYSPKYPLWLKYAHIGNIMGHELMHAFDADGVDEIPRGAKTWLQKDTMQTFTRKRDCLIKQYSGYCFKNQKKCLSGRRTITENMADMDGLKIAYMAYRFAIQTVGEEPPIPGFLDLSGDQLFFLATVRTQCTTGGEVEMYLKEDNDDPHAPDQARIDVPFRNFPIFAKLFKCEVGSFYAPLNTCSLWGAYTGAGRKNKKYS